MQKIFLLIPFSAIFAFMFGDNVHNCELLKIMVFVAGIDFVFGVAKAVHSNGFKRDIFWNGIFKKIAEIFVVSIAYQIDKIGIIRNLIDLQQATLYSYIAYEILSIISILKSLEIFIPQRTLDSVESLIKKEGDHSA